MNRKNMASNMLRKLLLRVKSTVEDPNVPGSP